MAGEEGRYLFGPLLAAAVDGLGGFAHGGLHALEEQRVAHAAAQQIVARGKGAVVAHQGGEVGAVGLRNHHVGEAPPFRRAPAYQVGVVGRHGYHREAPYVLRDSAVFLVVEAHFLTLSGRQRTEHGVGGRIAGVVDPAHHQRLLAVADERLLRDGAHRPREAQEMHRLQQVAFPHAVGPEQAVHSRAEVYLGLRYVLEVQYAQVLQVHGVGE